MTIYGVDFAHNLERSFTKAFMVAVSETIIKPIPVDVKYFNEKTTVVYWEDGTTTQSKIMKGDEFCPHVGFMACLAKKVYGGHNQYKKFIKNANVQKE